MEGKKQVGSSSSTSFTSDLFGSKESSGSSSTGIFSSIFGPSSKVFGKESLGQEVFEKRQDPANSVWNAKPGAPGNKEGGSEKQEKMESSYYDEERVQPCHLSSSIYYGGQDIFSHPRKYSHNSSAYSTYNKDGGEDDSGTASRGNWWQGSLYY